MKRGTKKKASPSPETGERLYWLQVELYSGPVTQEFADRNPRVYRVIQIRGDQTLLDLHFAIFDAFDREEEHMYEFQVGKRPRDRKALHYGLPDTLDDALWLGPEYVADLTETTIAALGLKSRQSFWYWFDFGDDWWHKITIKKIEPAPAKGKFPKVVERVGKSPPQYPDWDEDEYDDEEEDDEEDQDD